MQHLIWFLTLMATVCMQDYTETATIVFLFSVADWIESSVAHKVSLCRVSICSSCNKRGENSVGSNDVIIEPRKAVIAETGMYIYFQK